MCEKEKRKGGDKEREIRENERKKKGDIRNDRKRNREMEGD